MGAGREVGGRKVGENVVGEREVGRRKVGGREISGREDSGREVGGHEVGNEKMGWTHGQQTTTGWSRGWQLLDTVYNSRRPFFKVFWHNPVLIDRSELSMMGPSFSKLDNVYLSS